MWSIERFEFPFSKVRDSLVTYWETAITGFKLPYICLVDRFNTMLANPSLLTIEEITDVGESWKEIERGQAKKFKNVNRFLEELKS